MASCMLGRRSRSALFCRGTSQRPPLAGFCLLLQIRVSDGTVADAYTIQNDFVHLNHSNAPHLYEDRLVTLGVSHLQHKNLGRTSSNACFFFLLVGQQSYRSVLLMLLPSH